MKLKGLIFILVAALVVPAAAFAQDNSSVNPYAMIRLWGGVEQFSKEYRGATHNTGDMDTSIEKTAIIFVGLTAEQNGVKGHVEVGMGGVTPQDRSSVMDNNNNLYLRLAYITYNFSGVELLVGQNHTPYTTVSGQMANGDFLNLGFGATFDGRQPQIKLSYQGAYIAFIKANTPDVETVDVDVFMPKTAVGYNYKGEADGVKFNFGLGGAANMYKIDDTTSEINGKEILSYLAYLNGGLTVSDLSLKFNASYGQNTGNFGISHNGVLVPCLTKALADTYMVDVDKVKDTTVIEGFVELAYKAGPVTPSVAVGYLSADNKMYKAADRAIAYSGQVAIEVEKNFSIIPAFLYRDHMKDIDKNKQGSDLYAGIAFSGVFK